MTRQSPPGNDAATRHRRRGAALILVLVVGLLLVVLSAAALGTVANTVNTGKLDREVLVAQLASRSGVARAIADLKLQYTPSSTQWTSVGEGEFWVTTTYAAPTHTIRCWGRVRTSAAAAAQTTVAPVLPADGGSYDPEGWVMRGTEALIVRVKHIPNAPFYVGNGGVEKGRGGFLWDSSADLSDPSTWSYMAVNDTASAVQSYMGRDLPFRVDARDHDADFLDTGTPPAAAGTPHPYSLFSSQTLVGKHNAESWLTPWTNGSSTTYDPRTVTTPSPAATANFPSAENAFPVDTTIPDVQEFVWNLYEAYGNHGGGGDTSKSVFIDPNVGTVHVRDAGGATINVPGDTTTTLGSLADPVVAFVTGNMVLNAGETLNGYGILVIRDDFHPDVGPNTSNNQPVGATKEALARLNGNLNWTGLVLIAGWRPSVVAQTSGATNVVKINGALFAEDSVMSGGEIALDAAQIQFYIGQSKTSNTASTKFRITYSREIFEPGPNGIVYNLLPEIDRNLVYIRELGGL